MTMSAFLEKWWKLIPPLLLLARSNLQQCWSPSVSKPHTSSPLRFHTMTPSLLVSPIRMRTWNVEGEVAAVWVLRVSCYRGAGQRQPSLSKGSGNMRSLVATSFNLVGCCFCSDQQWSSNLIYESAHTRTGREHHQNVGEEHQVALVLFLRGEKKKTEAWVMLGVLYTQ